LYVTPDNLIGRKEWAKSALSLADVTCKYQYTVQNAFRNWHIADVTCKYQYTVQNAFRNWHICPQGIT